MSDVLFRLGARRTAETLFEALVPMTTLGLTFRQLHLMLARPTASRPFTDIELAVMLGGLVAVAAWYAGRQAYLIGARNPFKIIAGSYTLGGALVAMLVFNSASNGFHKRCSELRKGEDLVTEKIGGSTHRVCKIGGIAENPYLPGTLLRAPWSGHVNPLLVIWLAGISALTTLALRDVRLKPSRLGLDVVEQLQYAPALGFGGCYGDKPKNGRVQVCGNPTLWGEVCGQAYAEDRVFEPGEWCVRCAQTYRKCDRFLEFIVVTLFTADIDVLNGLERIDANSWDQGLQMPPDARLSGAERWVQLGRIKVPDVISVAQLISYVHDSFELWKEDANPDQEAAIELALKRSSKLAAWIWFGNFSREYTYARPTNRTLMAVGSSRLRDLSLDVGEELTLQLDIGLLPIEMRTAFRQTFMDPRRPPVLQNTKQDIWVPTAPKTSDIEGLWVPRIEGDALRTWLSLDRVRPEDALGVASPVPYSFPGEGPTELPPGSTVDLIQMPLDGERGLPVYMRRPGDSVAEWTWYERRLIERLRQEALVMVRA